MPLPQLPARSIGSKSRGGELLGHVGKGTGARSLRRHDRCRSTALICSTSTTISATRTGCCATPSASSPTTGCARTSASGSRTARCPARELAQEFGALGVLGMHLHGYGCQGARPSQYGLVSAEIEAVDSGLRSLVSVQGSLAMYAIYAYGSEEQKQRWLPEMAKGSAIGCFGLTEPDSGSDPGSMRTRARRDGSRLGPHRHQDVDHERVDRGCRRGVGAHRGGRSRVPGREGHDGLHRRRTSTTRSRCARRSPANSSSTRCACRHRRCSPSARGLRGPLGCLTEARFGIVWGVTGSARDALAATLDYAGSRTQFGKPIAGFQLTQRKLAEMAVLAAAGPAHRPPARRAQGRRAHRSRSTSASASSPTSGRPWRSAARRARSSAAAASPPSTRCCGTR